MKKNFIKRAAALVLSLILVVGLLPTTAFAEEIDWLPGTTYDAILSTDGTFDLNGNTLLTYSSPGGAIRGSGSPTNGDQQFYVVVDDGWQFYM